MKKLVVFLLVLTGLQSHASVLGLGTYAKKSVQVMEEFPVNLLTGLDSSGAFAVRQAMVKVMSLDMGVEQSRDRQLKEIAKALDEIANSRPGLGSTAANSFLFLDFLSAFEDVLKARMTVVKTSVSRIELQENLKKLYKESQGKFRFQIYATDATTSMRMMTMRETIIKYFDGAARTIAQ